MNSVAWDTFPSMEVEFICPLTEDDSDSDMSADDHLLIIDEFGEAIYVGQS